MNAPLLFSRHVFWKKSQTLLAGPESMQSMKPFSHLNIPTLIHPTTNEVVEAEAKEEGELTGKTHRGIDLIWDAH